MQSNGTGKKAIPITDRNQPDGMKSQAPQAESLITERCIHARYDLLKKIGEGGMGDIYSAFDRNEGKTVVVKLMRQALTGDMDAKARFLNEAKAVSAIRHENVIRIFDIDEYSGRPFMVMEFLDGKDLKEYLKEKGPLRWEDARRILIGVCDGIEAAHKAGIIHRDLKPQNIFILKETGKVKVLDLGLAKFMDNPSGPQTAVGMVAGTPDYMAPESINDRGNMDHRVDIYALGILIYKMVSGDLPFTSANQDQAGNLEILRMQTESQPIPPSIKHPELNIPREVEDIILKAMQKKKEDRHKDIGELRDAILRCEGSSTVMSAGSVLLDGSLRTRVESVGLSMGDQVPESAARKAKTGSFRRTVLLAASLATAIYAYSQRDPLGKLYEEIRAGMTSIRFEVPRTQAPKQDPKAQSQPQAAPEESAAPQKTFTIKVDSDPAGSIVYDVTSEKNPVELGLTPLTRELVKGEYHLLVTSKQNKRMQTLVVVSPQHPEEKVVFKKAAKVKARAKPPAEKGDDDEELDVNDADDDPDKPE